MGAYVIGADQGEAYWFLDNLMTVKASSGLTGNRGLALLEALMPPGSAPPPHVHEEEDEAWYVLEGAVEFTVAEKTFTARQGSFDRRSSMSSSNRSMSSSLIRRSLHPTLARVTDRSGSRTLRDPPHRTSCP